MRLAAPTPDNRRLGSFKSPMALLSLSNAQLAFGHVPLLDSAAFSLEGGERLGLIGRNGAGKSSLLKVIAGLEKLDDGLLQMTQGLRIRYVPQEPVFDAGHSVFEAVRVSIIFGMSLESALISATTSTKTPTICPSNFMYGNSHNSDGHGNTRVVEICFAHKVWTATTGLPKMYRFQPDPRSRHA